MRLPAYIIVLIVLAFFLLLGLLPIGADGGYCENAAFLSVRIGPLPYRILPQKERRETERQKAARLRKEEKRKVKKLAKAQKKAQKERKAPDVNTILALAKMGLQALQRFRKRLSVDYIRFLWTAAAGNPYDAAMQFGAVSAALGALTPLAASVLRVRQSEVDVSLRFDTEKPILDARLTLSLRVWEILWIGLAFGFAYLRFKYKNRRRTGVTERKDGNGKQ
jgi:hypothetical protein